MDSRVRTIVRAFSLLELSNSLEIVRRCARPTFIVVLFQSERAREREFFRKRKLEVEAIGRGWTDKGAQKRG